jgi:hypothetical protein
MASCSGESWLIVWVQRIPCQSEKQGHISPLGTERSVIGRERTAHSDRRPADRALSLHFE